MVLEAQQITHNMRQQLLNTQYFVIQAELEEYLTCGEASKPRGKYEV